MGKNNKNEEEEEEKKAATAQDDEENEFANMNKAQIARRAAFLLVVGVGMVSFFSDPMVGVITEMGTILNIPAFYVSFVVTPVCSNASELISSLIFASKKTKEAASMTFGQLLGAAAMNSTLALACLTGMIYFRDLVWEFSSETLCILVIVLVMGCVAMRPTTRTWFILPISFLYVFAIALVAFFDNVVGWK